jgi:hypothetical protein
MLNPPCPVQWKAACFLATQGTKISLQSQMHVPYENFILRLEYQTLGWYEGGILIHAPLDGPASKLGLQVHLRHDRLDYQARSPGAIYDVAAPKSLANFGSGNL